MCMPLLISEKSIRPSPIHVSPVAFENHFWGCPPWTDTAHVSQAARGGSVTVYAMYSPSEEKYGVEIGFDSFVSCTGSPSGSCFSQIWPRLRNGLTPRMNASMRPSGERIGAVAP